MSPDRLAAHLHLFKLGWQTDPSVLPRRAGTDHLTVETAAWLAEINEQLAELASARDIDIADMPPSEAITGEHFALPEPVRATVPKIPYQVALKLLTLAGPPVGLDVSRENALPRQVDDLDELTQAIESAEDYVEIRSYAGVLYAKEAGRTELPLEDGEPWNGIERTLEAWAPVDVDRARGRQVDAFQITQMSTVTRRSMTQWRARFRRVQLAARCAAAGKAGYELWRAALDLEARVPENVRGKAALRTYRGPIADITGVPPGAFGPRTHLWEGFANAEDLPAALDALADALTAGS